MNRIPLSQLKLWAANYREGDVGAIMQSISAFGFNGALRVWHDNTVIAGNHALMALQHLYRGNYGPPQHIDIQGDEWLIPVIDVTHLSKLEAQAFAIADNRTQELGNHDAQQLTALLQELSHDRDLLLATGYDDDSLDALYLEALNNMPDDKMIKCPHCGESFTS